MMKNFGLYRKRLKIWRMKCAKFSIFFGIIWVLIVGPLFASHDHKLLEDTLVRYNRDVTVLEIGECSTDSFLELAQRFPKSVFLTMGENQENFVEKIREKDLADNLIWLNHLPTFEAIQAISLCEHFDIIVLHPFLRKASPEEWDNIVVLCQHMSHHVIVESENPYILENHLPFSLIKRSYVHPRTIKRTFTLHFDYDQIFLVKVRPPYQDLLTSWQPGINLITYLAFNGYYPDRCSIISNLPIELEHQDWMPNNMILQGGNIQLIDRGDPLNDCGSGCSRLCQDEFRHTAQLIRESQNMTPEAVKRLFCKTYEVEGLLQIEETD